MEKRGSDPPSAETTRLASTRAPRVSRTSGSSGRPQTTSAASRPQPPEKTAAPVHRGAQGALAFREVDGTGPQHVELPTQPVQQGGGGQQPDAGRGQLDGQ